MSGKVLKVFSNDLNGNVDDRYVSVFAAFNHLKYSNRYVIFSFKGEYGNNLLYYGSVHLKEKSLVVFSTSASSIPVIDDFLAKLMSNNISKSEYEIFDISECEKIELISYNEKEFTNLFELDNLTIKKEVKKEELKDTKQGKPVMLYILLFIFISLAIGLTYIYLNPTVLDVELKQLNCSMNSINEKIDMDYHIEKIVKFDRKDIPVSVKVTETYKFLNIDEYNEFKNNKKENTYFQNGEYKYEDTLLELKIFYEEKTIIDDYKEMKNYLTNEGYTCKEETYYG